MGSTYYNDGFYGAEYTITDADGAVVATGPSDTGDWTASSDALCIPAGCYSMSVTSNGYDTYGYTWAFGDASGTTGMSADNISIGGADCNVCDDANYFENKINMDVSLWKQRYDVVFDETKLDIKTLEGYAGPAYGEAENIVFKMIANLAKVEGVFLDPVYTGKAFHGMVTELSLGDQGRLPGAKNIVFVHTGGLFGVFPHHENFQFD